MSGNLVKQLQSWRPTAAPEVWPIMREAATRIAALEAGNAKLLRQRDELLEMLRDAIDTDERRAFNEAVFWVEQARALLDRIEGGNQ